jgi:hypothetical protein
MLSLYGKSGLSEHRSPEVDYKDFHGLELPAHPGQGQLPHSYRRYQGSGSSGWITLAEVVVIQSTKCQDREP